MNPRLMAMRDPSLGSWTGLAGLCQRSSVIGTSASQSMDVCGFWVQIESVARDFMAVLFRDRNVVTDRLLAGIAARILNQEVAICESNRPENNEVLDFSIRNSFSNACLEVET
jgi:hypothetical protein